MALLTTRVEVVTNSGCRASLDTDGWHSADPRLLERLRRQAPVRIDDGDPLYDAAQLAARAMGVRIVVMRRRGVIGELVGRTSRLFHALTDSSLKRALGTAEQLDGPTTQVRHLRHLRQLALLRVALLLAGLGAALIAYGYLSP